MPECDGCGVLFRSLIAAKDGKWYCTNCYPTELNPNNPINDIDNGTIRTFATGATRDTAIDKLDYEGFLSPLVLQRYAEYMHKCRHQSDGTLRDSDNWQKGIPIAQYMKSKWRHFMDTWMWWRHRNTCSVDIEETLCAEMFNTMGMLLEVIKKSVEE